MLLCFLLIIIYGNVWYFIYKSIINLNSKNEYFLEHLPMEKERIRKQNEDFKQLHTHFLSKFNRNNPACVQYDHAYAKVKDDLVFRLIENSQHIKQEYGNILYSLQHLLIFLSFLNTTFMMMIYKKPLKLFILSNSLCFLCFCINENFLFEDRWMLRSTIIIGFFNVGFSIYLLFCMVSTLITVCNYQKMKRILINN